MKIKITKRIELDYGHTLPNHFGFCNQLHGHRAFVEATVQGDLIEEGSSEGMVLDFSFLKEIMMETIHAKLDHGFAIWEKDTKLITVLNLDKNGFPETRWDIDTLSFIKGRNKKVLEMNLPPTAEALALWAFNQISNNLFEKISQKTIHYTCELVSVKWYETPNSYAEVHI